MSSEAASGRSNEFEWSALFDASSGLVRLPSVDSLVVTGVEQLDGASNLEGEVGLPPRRMRVQVPEVVKSVELSLTGDLALQFEGKPHLEEILVGCPGSVHWFGFAGADVGKLIASDTFLGARSAGDGVGLDAVRTRAGLIELQCRHLTGIMVGWLQAKHISMSGDGALILCDAGGPPAGVTTESISVESGRIDVRSHLATDRVRKHTTVTLDEDAVLQLGGVGVDYPAESRYLTVRGGRLHLRSGEVQALRLNDVEEFEIGTERPPDAESAGAAAERAVASLAGFGLATVVSGSCEKLVLRDRAVVAGDPRHGFTARRIEAHESAELSGLDADGFNYGSSFVLQSVRRVGLWVSPSTRAARTRFEHEVRLRSREPDPALFDLAHKRRRLLQLARETLQDGHTLSVLREAEKDARRASLPATSRERVLLELWRRLLGYGERIGYPLVVGSLVIAVLGLLRVGVERVFSRQWWQSWDVDRVDRIVGFALPGVEILGLEGEGGLLGVAAKAVSVIFLGAAVTAAVRVAKRSE